MCSHRRRSRDDILAKRTKALLRWTKRREQEREVEDFIDQMRTARKDIPGATQEIPISDGV